MSLSLTKKDPDGLHRDPLLYQSAISFTLVLSKSVANVSAGMAQASSASFNSPILSSVYLSANRSRCFCNFSTGSLDKFPTLNSYDGVYALPTNGILRI